MKVKCVYKYIGIISFFDHIKTTEFKSKLIPVPAINSPHFLYIMLSGSVQYILTNHCKRAKIMSYY